MTRLLPTAAACCGFVAVAAGAFGAHALKTILSPEASGWWSTAVQYQFTHAIAILIIAVLASGESRQLWYTLSGYTFLAGILVFCGCLYAMALGAPRWLGAVVPLGGICFLAGWAAMAAGLSQSKRWMK